MSRTVGELHNHSNRRLIVQRPGRLPCCERPLPSLLRTHRSRPVRHTDVVIAGALLGIQAVYQTKGVIKAISATPALTDRRTSSRTGRQPRESVDITFDPAKVTVVLLRWLSRRDIRRI